MALPDPLIGKKLGDYTIEALLGKGGMARVYRGYDENLDRYAAVKVISSEFAATVDQLEYTERFQREARAIARLRHPHIVGVYQFGHAEDLYYMAMVFLDGEDLRFQLRNYAMKGKRMPLNDVLRMAAQIGDALDYAHSQGVIHRDIKPSNIMMTSHGAVLTDFGLALSTAEGTMGDTFGSAHYIAPEQAVSSARAVPQSDLYSLGIVLYEALAGKVPFDDPSAMSVALKHLNEAPPPMREINPELPPAVEDVIFKVLDKEPSKRYESGKTLVNALYKAVDKKPVDLGETVTNGKTLVDEDVRPKTGNLLKTATQEMKTSTPSAKEEDPDSPLDAYLKSLREGSHTKRPSIAKNILTDIIKDRTSPKPPKEETSPKPASVVSDIGTTKPEPPQDSAKTVKIPTVDEKPAEEKPQRRLPITLIAALVLLLIVSGGAFIALSGSGGAGEEDGNTNSSSGVVDENSQTPTSVAVLATDSAIASATLTLTPDITITTTEEDADETPADTGVEVAATQVATDQPTETVTPTSTRTRRPTAITTSPVPTDTEVPTSAPTATREPTGISTPTATRTRRPSTAPSMTSRPTTASPTSSPTIETTASPPDIRLEYDNVHFKLINISGRTRNISNLIFEGDEQGRFEAFDWSEQTALGDAIFRIRDAGCLQVVVSTNDVEPPDSSECRFHNFWLLRASSISQFWRAAAGNETFTVFSVDIGEVIATCSVAAGECEFALP